MSEKHSEALRGYCGQVLAGTGLSARDVTGAGTPAEGSAAHALREGWEIAARAQAIQDGLGR